MVLSGGSDHNVRMNAPASPASPASTVAAAQLAVSGLTVRFGALTALDGVHLALRAGELVALAGENGAGKTTLIRASAGDVTPASGAIRLAGQAVRAGPSAAAKRRGPVVWQDLALADNLDVAANVMLGNERRRHLFSEVALHRDAARLFDRLGIPLQDTTRPVRLLSGGQRQMVAVARAMAHNPRLLLLDEPTASLGVREAALVERLITRLRAAGHHDPAVRARHRADVPAGRPDRGAAARPGGHRGRRRARCTRTTWWRWSPASRSTPRRAASSPGCTGSPGGSSPPTRPRSLSLILSALGAALGSERLAIHLLEDGSLVRAASLGMPEALLSAWERLPVGAAGGPVGLAAERQAAGHRGEPAGGGGSWQVVRQPGPAREGRELLVGARARARRAARRDHRVPRDAGQAAPRRPGPRRALRRVRGQRHRAGPAA